MQLKKIIDYPCLSLIISLLCGIGPVYSQSNLLLNGHFEDINTCAEFKAECGVEGWFYLKDIKMQMLSNFADSSLTGKNSFGIFYNWNGYSGFTPIIGTLLPCRLQKGKSYIFSGMISIRMPSAMQMQPAFSTGSFFYIPKRPFAAEMEPVIISKVVRIPGKEFYIFSYTFIANGHEQYLTFGTYTSLEAKGNNMRFPGMREINLIMDNFSLTPVDSTEIMCDHFLKNKQSIYAYNYRHKEMDYTLFGKGKLPVQVEESVTTTGTPLVKKKIEMKLLPPVIADTLKLGDVLFDFNKSVLKTAAYKVLDSFFYSKRYNGAIDSMFIEGHTDSIGSDEKNMLLSQQRCEAVQAWMIENYIVTPDAIQIHPFGKSRPIADNGSAQGRALNRRVEIIVFRKRPGN